MPDRIYRVAVIGGGPRGLASLEYLYRQLATRAVPITVKSVLYEPDEFPGSGPVYSPHQSCGNWLNIPERLVDIEARPEISLNGCRIPGFPSYSDWAANESGNGALREIDHYPPRAKLGRYLNARFNTLADVLQRQDLLIVIRCAADRIEFLDGQIVVKGSDGQVTQADEVALTLGHQPARPDQSMIKWTAWAERQPGLTLISDPYPSAGISGHESIDPESNVAIRGFGLAMIDVVKGLTEARGGRFVVTDKRTREMTYEPCGQEPRRMIPFSLDGLPLVPKPLNASVDERFEPSLPLKQRFEDVCCDLAAAGGCLADPLTVFIDAVSEISACQFLSLGNSVQAHSLTAAQLQTIASRWLADSEAGHELIASPELPAEVAIQKYVRMACELEPFTFDYCMGQVWRHLQSILFESLAHAALPPESIRDMINLHERMKRYAFGPPVDNMQRLLALSKQGLLSFVVVDDPDIRLTPEGWIFHSGHSSICATVMIDSVLASADLEKVNSALIRQLQNDGRLLVMAESLGARTTRDGLVVQAGQEEPAALAMLGRLAKGSLIGTDSLTECFGEQQGRWAKGVMDRLATSADEHLT